jgi:tetratricopeptide (TPR) repeat protein
MNNQGEYDAALAVTRRALAVRERIFGPSHPSVASTLQTIGNALLSEGDAAGAEAEYQRAVDIRVAAFGLANVGTVEVIEAVGNARLHRGDLEGALSSLKQALELMESFLPPDDEELASKLVNLADAYVALKRSDDALPLYARALHIVETSYGATSWLLAYPLEGIGRAWLEKGAPAKALPPLERALVAVASPDADPEVAAETRCTMALALAANHQAEGRARALAAQAREALAQHPAANAARLATLDAAFPVTR